MQNLIQEAIKKGIISFDAEMKNITYTFQNKKRNYQNPEEQVQAEAFCKLVLHYGYSDKQILQFVSVTMGSTVKEADIVVYKDSSLQNPYIVIECKKEDVSELEFQQASDQAFSYAHALAGTTKYVWVTKGNKEEFYTFNKESNKKITLNNIPHFGDTTIKRYRYAKGGYYMDKIKGKEEKITAEDLSPISENALIRKFKQAHDALRGGGELNPSQAFDELDKLIFCKIWDEKKTPKGKPYQFQIFADEEEDETANLQALQKRINDLYDNGKIKDPEIFNKPIELKPERLRTIVEYFKDVNFSKTDLDSKGKAFETFLGSYFRGDFGAFFTPRNVVRFAVDVLPITHESKVLDTSCGSGGFLLYCLDKVRRQADNLYPNYKDDADEREEHFKHWHDFAEKRLFGIEINDQIARTAKMNMIIHDDGHTNVVQFDGLFEPEYIAEKTKNQGFKRDNFDFIVTNPPFGSIIKQSEKAYMQIDNTFKIPKIVYQFAMKELSWIDKAVKKQHIATNRENQATEILFIEQCHKFLKEGGYMAIVLPDGILTNSSLAYVRESIEEMFRIVAVVSLPQTAFTHTGAGVKSSVLFLKKWDSAKTKKIKDDKQNLQNHIAQTRGVRSQIEAWENQKKDFQKQLKKATEQHQKDNINEKIAETNETIQNFRDELEYDYQQAKSKMFNYPIFMAIAENIGYDATGKDNFRITHKDENFIYNQEKHIKEIQENDLFTLEVIKKLEKLNGKNELVTKKQNLVPNTGIMGELQNFIQAIENNTDSVFL
jgi:type I restriction enzyme M protein